MVNKLDFVGIPTQDAKRAKAFYVETLGLKPDENTPTEVWAGETCLSIWEPGKEGWPFAPQKNGHIAFNVDDVDASRAELESKGVVFAPETLDSGVCKMAFFNDPDGNDLMLHSRYAPYG